MPLDDNTQSFGDQEERMVADPLGIIGWEIGGKYKIRSYIGGGGFGEVYDAYNLNLVEQRLVIKFFKRVQARDRFDREAKILCMLDHPNISRVIDYLPDEGALVVQYIDGKDTAQIVRESGRMPAALFLKVARAVTEAIAYAHETKVAHRDIKPANILIDKNEHVYLIDFGIAKEIGGDATKTGYQALTPMFAAPERQTGESSYNPFLSDIYELGITLFNFVTTSLPYRNPVKPSLDGWGGQEAAPLSPQLRHILRKATHPDPDQRYGTAADMAGELQGLEEVYVVKKKRAGLVASVLIVAAVAVVAFLGRGYISDMIDGTTSSENVVVVDEGQEVASDEMAPTRGSTVLRDSQEIVSQEGQVDEPALELAVTEIETPVVDVTPEQDLPPQQAIEAPVEEATVEQVVETPPPPELTIFVEPGGDVAMYVDGVKRRSGAAFESTVGTHSVEIAHPDYPVLRKTLRMSEESTTITYEMNREFAGAETLSLQLALFPPSDKNLVEFKLNGHSRRYTQFPVFDLTCLAGQWNLELSMVPVNSETGSNPKVDSCATFPYGRGPRNKIAGDKGVIELLGGENGNTVPLLIYWSE